MIAITAIRPKRGYSNVDHLIDDSAYQNFVGQQFESVRDIRRAVNAKSFTEKLDFRVRNVPVAVEIRLPTGDANKIDV